MVTGDVVHRLFEAIELAAALDLDIIRFELTPPEHAELVITADFGSDVHTVRFETIPVHRAPDLGRSRMVASRHGQTARHSIIV